MEFRIPRLCFRGRSVSLPRVLDLDGEHRLLTDPAPEVCSSHDPDWSIEEADFGEDAPFKPGEVQGDCLELVAEIDPGKAEEVGIKLRRSPGGEEETLIRCNLNESSASVDTRQSSLDPETGRSINGTPFALKAGEPLRLHIFLDRSTVEVFANRRACLSCRTYPTREDSLGVELFAEGGAASVNSLKVWKKKSNFYPS